MNKIVIGITGATGTTIGLRVIEVLRDLGVETHVVVSRWGMQTLSQETGRSLDYIRSLSSVLYPPGDMGAAISSGSFGVDSMIIAPCSMRSTAAIALGLGDNLIHRAADVMLKERKKIVIIPRETPLSEVHLKHMLSLSRMGAVIMPPNPAYYSHPSTLKDVVDQFVARILDQVGIEAPFANRWKGMKSSAQNVISIDSD
tara:strand:- start:57058 stop:57657 length:600 start_codon:yes stop_codon:yes gene_type:complete